MSAQTENMLNTMNLAQSNIAESAKLEQDARTEKERLKEANMKLLADKVNIQNDSIAETSRRREATNEARNQLDTFFKNKQNQQNQQNQPPVQDAKQDVNNYESLLSMQIRPKLQDDAVRFLSNSVLDASIDKVRAEADRFNKKELGAIYVAMGDKFNVKTLPYKSKSRAETISLIIDLIRRKERQDNGMTPLSDKQKSSRATRSTTKKQKTHGSYYDPLDDDDEDAPYVEVRNKKPNRKLDLGLDPSEMPTEGAGFILTSKVYKHNVALLKKKKKQ
jgi:hypothetical protein